MSLTLLKYLRRSEIFYVILITSHSLKQKQKMKHNRIIENSLEDTASRNRGSMFSLRTRKGLSQIDIFSARNVQRRIFYSKQI